MRIEPSLYLVGSGQHGFDLTDAYDCNVYLFDAGDEYFVFDAGAGLDVDQILSVCQEDGLDLDRVKHLFLTHAHTDHAGGTAMLHDNLDVKIYASPETARIVSQGDEEAVCLPAARAGGMYPTDYVYHACPVDHSLKDGDTIEIGPFRVETVATPGHSHDHNCYLVDAPGKRYLISGDAIFFGGKIVLQNTYDCDVPQSIASIKKLAGCEFDALLGGHLNFSLARGKRHIESACAIIDQLGCPPSI